MAMFCWLGTIWCTHFLLDKHIPSHIYLRGKGRLNHPQLIKSLFILLPFLFTLFFSNSSVWMTLEDTLVGLLSLGRTASAHILTGSLRDERSNQLGFLTGFCTQGAQACEELQISVNKLRYCIQLESFHLTTLYRYPVPRNAVSVSVVIKVPNKFIIETKKKRDLLTVSKILFGTP